MNFHYKHNEMLVTAQVTYAFVCVSAVVSTSLTESTLKMVPQVVNVQELKDKGPVPVSTIPR